MTDADYSKVGMWENFDDHERSKDLAMCGPTLRNLVSLCALTSMVFIFSGCSTLNPLANRQMPTAESNDPTAMYRVEMHAERGQPKIFDGSLNSASGRPVTVQTALEASGAIDKYTRLSLKPLDR